MLKNYITIGWRNLLRNQSYSFINVGGLSIGMAAAMLIGLWAYDELSFDRCHQNHSHIAQLMVHLPFTNAVYTSSGVPRPLEPVLRTEYTDNFDHIVMSSTDEEHVLANDDVVIRQRGRYMQDGVGNMLGLRFRSGGASTLQDPNSVVVSASTEKALFGNRDALGKTIMLNQNYNVKVTGVFEDLPSNSSFNQLDFIASWSLLVSSDESVRKAETDWWNQSFHMYVQIAEGQDMTAISKRIRSLWPEDLEQSGQSSPEFLLHPMDDWHLRSNWVNGVQTGGRIDNVWLFLIIGGFVLLLACINFINLSTARSERRALEVGIRKSIGSTRSQLSWQFFNESLVVVAVSFCIAFLLVISILPQFNILSEKEIVFPWDAGTFWIASLIFIFITAIIAGSYPALYLSSLDPVNALQGTLQSGKFAGLPRKFLVVTQFTVSVILIIGTTLVYRQIQHSKNRPVGYSRNGLVQIPINPEHYEGKYDLIRNELMQSGAVSEMSSSHNPVTSVSYFSSNFDWEGKAGDFRDNFAIVNVSVDYGKSVGWEISEGRDFSRDFAADSAGVILNVTATRYMDLADPVGKTITWDETNTYTIIGIVKDMLMLSPYEAARQTIYMFGGESHNTYNLRLNPAMSAHEGIAVIESVFEQVVPGDPVTYRFVDEVYGDKFRAEERIGKLAGIFTILAIMISCLGLFGLASFIAVRRTKEIGIRKVMGASPFNLWQMLTGDFVALVIISCLVAVPVAHYLMNSWLQKYDYRTDLSWWIFVSASGAALIITVITVSYQTLKAAWMNPVKSLKEE